MRGLLLTIAILAPPVTLAQQAQESSNFYFKVTAISDEALAAAIKGAVEPFGYIQHPAEKRILGSLGPKVIGVFSASRPALALVVPAETATCIAVFVTDLVPGAPPRNHSAQVVLAIQGALRRAFPSNVTFHSDEKCSTAL